MALIACVDLDPVIVGLVRRVRPDDEVVEVEVDELVSGRRIRYAAVVAGASERVLDVLAEVPIAPRVVMIARARDPLDLLDHPGPIVRRPVEPTELRLALARVAPLRRRDRWRRRLTGAATTTSIDGIFAVARVGAVTAASALTLTHPLGEGAVPIVVAIVVWAALRVWLRQSNPVAVGLDVVLATAAVLTTNGTESPFLLLAAVVAAELGYTFRVGVVGTVVGLGTAAGLASLSYRLMNGTVDVVALVAWGTVLPLAGAIGVLGTRMQQSPTTGSVRALEELHETLDRLARQAQGVAGTLELSSVAERVLRDLRRDVGAVASVLLVGDAPVREVVAATGLTEAAPARVVLGDARVAGPPDALVPLLPDGQVMCVALEVSGIDRGAIVAVLPESRAGSAAQAQLREVAREAALALENARLFQGIQQLSVDTERRRLARDLHDGVIQSLVHVGLELDLVGASLADDSAGELRRLRAVVGRTVDEVRATVNDLRSARLSAGLGPALRSLVRDYEREGLQAVADVAPVEELAPEIEVQLFRIAQEAVSNAVHHGRPSSLAVRLWESEFGLHLQVLDDGIGMAESLADPVGEGRGVGLRAMQERVDLLGARLDLGPRDEGGTCVQVDLPREGRWS